MNARIYTVGDLADLAREYDAAWKAATTETEIPSMPQLEGEFDPRGLEDAVGQAAEDIEWLAEFIASCPKGKWWRHRTALVEFALPNSYRRYAAQRDGHTARINHRELGDIHIDVDYEEGCVRVEFVSLL